MNGSVGGSGLSILRIWFLLTHSQPSEGLEVYSLNRIRNAVMHPVKKRRWSEDKFEFAHIMRPVPRQLVRSKGIA